MGTLAMLRTRVSEILFQFHQAEAKLGPSASKVESDAVYRERQGLLDQFREAKTRLDAFKLSVELSDEDRPALSGTVHRR